MLAGRQARRLYVAIKFNIITLTSDPGTQLVNKQGGTCYNAKDADLRLFVLPAYLFLHDGTIYKRQTGRGTWA